MSIRERGKWEEAFIDRFKRATPVAPVAHAQPGTERGAGGRSDTFPNECAYAEADREADGDADGGCCCAAAGFGSN